MSWVKDKYENAKQNTGDPVAAAIVLLAETIVGAVWLLVIAIILHALLS